MLSLDQYREKLNDEGIYAERCSNGLNSLHLQPESIRTGIRLLTEVRTDGYYLWKRDRTKDLYDWGGCIYITTNIDNIIERIKEEQSSWANKQVLYD